MISFKHYWRYYYSQRSLLTRNKSLKEFDTIIYQGFLKYVSFFLTNSLLMTALYIIWMLAKMVTIHIGKIGVWNVTHAFFFVYANFFYIWFMLWLGITVAGMIGIYLIRPIVRKYMERNFTMKEYLISSMYTATSIATLIVLLMAVFVIF